ncbi:MAG: ECF transporter S component [Lachnospiraceae bacterium]|nr:ECF transporter S component [Lachnospiraceae bacterium]
MKPFNTKKLVTTALFAALCCVATMSIRIPTPGTSGYIHPGDAVVILCGVFLDPVSAFLAAGIGSCMADLLGGYFIYVPITFLIKGLTAYLGSRLFHHMTSQGKPVYAAVPACGIIDILMVAGGYCACECVLYGAAAAFASVPANLVQGISGLVISSVLYPLLRKPVQLARV